MISDNLIDIQRRIDSALTESGRKPDSCTLIGVSKTKPVSLIREAFNSGLRDFGENYVEEFVSKYQISDFEIKKEVNTNNLVNTEKDTLSKDKVSLSSENDKELKEEILETSIKCNKNGHGYILNKEFVPMGYDDCECDKDILQYCEDELNERINTIVSDNSLLIDKKEETKPPQDKKPKLPLS